MAQSLATMRDTLDPPMETFRSGDLGIVRAVLAVVLLAAAVLPGLAGAAPEVRLFDDFWYYILPAERFVAGEVPAFYPGVPTNGWHPLWFLWLSALLVVTGGLGPLFYFLVDTSIGLLCVATLLASERLLTAFTADRHLALAGAALIAAVSWHIGLMGLESSLVMFLATMLLVRLAEQPMEEQSAQAAVATGVLAALVTLARLDAILYPVLFIAFSVGIVATAPVRFARAMAWFTLGLVPLLALYVGINLAVFDTATSVSSQAKQLKGGLSLAWGPWQDNADFHLVGFIALLLGATFLWARRDLDANRWRIALVILSAPPVSLALHMILGSWRMWPWHFYATPVATALALVLAGEVGGLRAARMAKWVCASVTLGAIAFGLVRVSGPGIDVVWVGRWVAALAKDRPGVWGMGDCAGAAAHLSRRPFVQLEGVIMDRALLDDIRAERPLLDVLAARGVDWYVATNPKRSGNCFAIAEPRLGGPEAPRMRGVLCEAPVASSHIGRFEIHVFAVSDVARAREAALRAKS